MRATTQTVTRRLAQAFLLLITCAVSLQAAADAPKRFRMVKVEGSHNTQRRFIVTEDTNGDAAAAARVPTIIVHSLQPGAQAVARPLDTHINLLPEPAQASARKHRQRTLIQQSVLHRNKGEYDQAIGCALFALEYGHSPAAVFQVALNFETQGDTTKAITWYNRWLKDAPKGRIQEQVRERVQRLKATL
jgi:tetratricopeptide (TPR) repeat protein